MAHLLHTAVGIDVTSIALPIPVPDGMPSAVGGIFLLIALGVVAVLVWQTVRFFRGPGDR